MSAWDERSWGVVLALALLGSVTVARADGTKTEKKGRPMSKNTEVLERIDELAKQRPFRPEGVGKLTGLPLQAVSEGSNAYFTVYKSPAGKTAAPFAAVELRSPTSKSKKDGLVIVEIETDCLKLADIGERWGKGEWAGPPRLEMPAGRPDYYTFEQPWGLLRLGFSPRTGCLVAAVLDGASR